MNNELNENNLEQVNGGTLLEQRELIMREFEKTYKEFLIALEPYKDKYKEVYQTAQLVLIVKTIGNFNKSFKDILKTLAEVMNSCGILADPNIKALWDRILLLMNSEAFG